MPTLRSHTHLQATQANTQTKACKRVCLPNRTRTLQTRHDRALTERRAATNTGLAKVAVQCSADTFVVNQSLVLRINICGENRHLRQARKRYGQATAGVSILDLYL
jgi:hypothetical protein